MNGSGGVAILLSVSLAATAAAQSDSLGTISGRVLDATDSGAVGWAEVSIAGTSLVARADGRGNYRLGGIRPGPREVMVRAIGYARLTQSEDFTPRKMIVADMYLMRLPHVLTQMVIHGQSFRVPRQFEDVYRRGARGWGKFITREQIDSLNPIDLEMLLAQLPGVKINQQGVFFRECGNAPGDLYVDGTRVTRFDARNTWFDFMHFVNPKDVQAIEVYDGSINIPAEFMDANPCAVVAIWTKRGP